ncbi:bifunctional 4-hydroxy-2-oxoglutarate aldolase/2-dehydro-3-deoxy-phosphogluconate aldolase [Sodalinema gerasimenkoae]|uniref:bifunctional 4-hydroxy-2-oxoglutarate aldolase/2-dehydro-3-deoxy-phosphogluconate aldolase n=1 Tax=Sodalinema gerasimenkoae TaxID=2862348 RepID=UPI00135679EF|nr:bifunctional 4-hydroxy-2-oxoglutarate aldolase/2-dehydro-3-deoxy-phosphogluconate aldolase [Sodalinema gerasimenkoae]
MTDWRWLEELKQKPVIAVIRAPSLALGERMAAATIAGGLSYLEVTWTSDRPTSLIQRLRERFPHCQVGAGTLMSQRDLAEAIAAGAQFLFSPHLDVTLLEQAIAAEIPMIPGALTPTEIIQAWQAGATAVKVFPISAMGGVSYLRSLQVPLGGIPLIPTGGVTWERAPDFLEAGAVAVGVSTGLFPPSDIAAENWQEVEARSRRWRGLYPP